MKKFSYLENEIAIFKWKIMKKTYKHQKKLTRVK